MAFLGGALASIDEGFNKLTGAGSDPDKSEALSPDPYSAIAEAMNVQIEEKVSVIEAAAAMLGQEIEMPNRYSVLINGMQKYFAYEETNMCYRQCQSGLCCVNVPWNVDLRAVNGAGQAERAFKFTQDCAFTFCCFGRPNIDIIEEQSGQLVATATDPCSCLNFTMQISDAQGEEMLDIEASGCQPGLCCPCPCGPCAEVHFDITDSKTGEDLGDIKKVVPGFMNFVAAPDVDNYHINMEGVKDPRMKIAVLATAIFIDFRYFNNNSNDDGGTREDILDQAGVSPF